MDGYWILMRDSAILPIRYLNNSNTVIEENKRLEICPKQNACKN